MTPQKIAPLLALPLLGVGAAVTAATGRLELGLMAGLVAALLTAVVTALATRTLGTQNEALVLAARRLQSDLAPVPPTSRANPVELARRVSEVAERARAQGRELGTLTAVLDAMAEGIWMTDTQGVIIRHNDALKHLLFSGQELLGHTPLEVVRSGPLDEAVKRACQAGETSRLEIFLEGVRPRALAVHVAPLREVGGSAAVFHDVTELRRLEKVRKDFVANVSHELRTPITAIRGYAETLTGGALADPENARRMVDIIHRQSERLSELVEDLLELSRIESRELQLAKVAVPLAEVAHRAADAVRPKAQDKGVELHLHVPERLSALGDARALEQVLLNLLDNAVKYTPRAGWVEVRAWLDAERCILSVRDTGIGIEAAHLSRIFERFYRVDKGRSRDMGGTGLGLSIVKNLVTAMGGDVGVESRPGAGSTFTVSLPSAST